MTRRLSFLSAFFILLGVVFAGAVVMRVRSYSMTDDARAESIATPSAADAEPATRRSRTRAPMERVTEAPTGVATSTAANAEAAAQPMSRRERLFRELLEKKVELFTGRPANEILPTSMQSKPAPTPNASIQPPAQQQGAARGAGAPNVASSRSMPRPEPSTPYQSGSQQQQPQSGRDTPRDREREKDPTSDTSAPRVVSIAFVPPNVRDGEQTMLMIQATDDLSGVRSISGSIISPSGGLQGFALQRDGMSDNWSTRITVAKDSPEGVWHINYLSLTDQASNAANLNLAQGQFPITASFTVASQRPDSQGPTLSGVSLEKSPITAGEKVVVTVRAEDDNSGVKLVSGVFHSPTKLARLGFGCRALTDGLWRCEVQSPPCLDCGDWQLEQLQLQDNANNMTTVRQENTHVSSARLTIVGEACDNLPPSMTSLKLDQTVVSNVEATTIVATADVGDDGCKLSSVSGQATGPAPEDGQQPPRIYFSLTPSNDPAVWTGRILVPKLAAKGVWTVTWVQLLDKGNNLKTYSQSDPLLQNATFTVR